MSDTETTETTETTAQRVRNPENVGLFASGHLRNSDKSKNHRGSAMESLLTTGQAVFSIRSEVDTIRKAECNADADTADLVDKALLRIRAWAGMSAPFRGGGKLRITVDKPSTKGTVTVEIVDVPNYAGRQLKGLCENGIPVAPLVAEAARAAGVDGVKVNKSAHVPTFDTDDTDDVTADIEAGELVNA